MHVTLNSCTIKAKMEAVL